MSRSIVLMTALFLSTIPAVAAAQEPSASAGASAPDEVVLKNGGLVRGTVVGLDPGHQVVISVPGVKDARTIPWAEVADVERGKYSDHPASSGPPLGAVSGYSAPVPPPTAAATPLEGPGIVRVHVDSPDPVQLFERRGVAISTMYGAAYLSTSKLVCSSPCDQTIDARQGGFYVAGPSVPGSSEFLMSDRKGDVLVKVDPGSKGQRAGGIVLLSLGAAGMLAGVVMMAVGATSNSLDRTIYDDGTGAVRPSSSSSLVPAGGVAIGVGAASLIGGIVLIVTARTHVEVAGEPKEATVASARKARYWLGEF